MSQQIQVSNKNNYRRRISSVQVLEFQSPEKEKLDNDNDQPRFSQDFVVNRSEQEIPQLNLSIDNILQNNSQKDDPGITTPKKDTFQLSSFSDALNQQNNQQNNNKLYLQKNLLSPTSSQSSVRSSRSSLSSPVQIRINPNQNTLQLNSTRRSLHYEISQIQEKRLEDEKQAISYAEKVLMNRNFLSQQKSKQENQRYSLFVTTAQQAGVYVSKEGQQQGILKKRVNTLQPPNPNQQINQTNNTMVPEKIKSSENIDLVAQNNNLENVSKINKIQLPDRSELNNKAMISETNQFAVADNKLQIQNQNLVAASSKVRGRRTIGNANNLDLLSTKEISFLDKKTLTKITKENTERNSIIQPERSMEDHYNKLPRCMEHSKRIKELYCVDENCQIKNKFGCVLCFSSVNGSPHNFHEYYTISSEEDLQEKINRNRADFIQFIKDQINVKSEAKNSTIRKYQDQITDSLINYAIALQDRLFIGFEEEEIQKFQLPLLQGLSERKSPTRKSKRKSKDKKEIYDEKELSIILYLELLSKQLDKKVENQIKIWIDQDYLGLKDEEFLREKMCKLIIISKCFSNLSENVFSLFVNSEQIPYDQIENENNNPKLYYISDPNCDGVYQLDQDKNKQGRGISFFKSGGVYEGYFKNNQKHGKGKQITLEGDIYIGEFCKNVKKGKGVLKYANKDIYTGEFYQDTCHGLGSMYYAADQTTYIGGWNKNQRHGKGQIFKDNQLISSGIYIGDHLKQNPKE